MTKSTNLKSDELIEKFKGYTLDPKVYSHEIQLKITWILIRKYGLEVATIKNASLTEQYYLHTLKSTAFNKILNRAYTEILFHFMERSSSSNFEKLMLEFPRLKHNFKNLVKTHYGYDILKQGPVEEIAPTRPILFTF